jgi:hypothetical protein
MWLRRRYRRPLLVEDAIATNAETASARREGAPTQKTGGEPVL